MPGADSGARSSACSVRRRRVTAAQLNGAASSLTRVGEIEVYDVSTGARALRRPTPQGFGLVDVDGGVAVLLTRRAVMLLRLDDGRSRTLTPGHSTVMAELEPPGLYYSYGTADGGPGRIHAAFGSRHRRGLQGSLSDERGQR